MLEVVSTVLLLLMPLLGVFVVCVYLIGWWRERNLSPEEKARRTQLRSGGMNKKHFRILLIVRLAVLGLLAGIVIVSFFEAREKYEQQFEPLVTPETEQQPNQQISSETVDTASWQTYRNEEYGFEVKYPADTITSYAWDGNSNTPILGVPTSREGPLIYFRVLLRDRGDTVPQDSLLGRSDEAWEKVGPVEKEIDGEIVYVNEFRGKQWNWLAQEYYFSDFVLLFSYDDIRYTGIGNQILSTFRFTP